MPIYEYKCKKCGRITEFLEKRDNEQTHVCQMCGSRDMHRVISTFSAGKAKSQSCPTGTCPLS
ncbi:MAG: zinc ribbon domain-containing protein [Sedimentisphaerales bacterium]|nr:zinc ribbon domain-containing protein [Sedimentisphaerales bacterium]